MSRLPFRSGIRYYKQREMYDIDKNRHQKRETNVKPPLVRGKTLHKQMKIDIF